MEIFMEYKKYNCPVCGERFEDGDDIVVCPECGAPHHRKCYEEENRCAYADKHSEDFDFESVNAQQNDENTGAVICPRCQAENPAGMFYCGKCGFPLGFQQQNPQYAQNAQNQQNARNGYQQTQNGMPFGFGAAFTADPMGGIPSETDLGDGVTAGEASKFVQKNTPYFIRVFNKIKTFSSGRFSFCGFLFTGGYLLYRKMYKLGGIITAIMILLITAETYITYSTVYSDLSNAIEQVVASKAQYSFYGSGYFAIYEAFLTLDLWKQVVLGVMVLCSVLRLVIQIVVGINANKWYFKHCKKEIKAIKDSEANPQQALETRGGVNLALAVSMYAVYLAINYIPLILQM